MRSVWYVPLLIMLWAVPLASCGQPRLGRVSIAGRTADALELNKIRVEREGKQVPTALAMKLREGDVITTDAETSLVLHWKGAEAILTPGTRVTLGSIFTWFGEVFVSGWLAGKTKLATAAVEGTEYVVRVDPRTDETLLSVFEGKVRVASSTSAWPNVLVTAGRQVRITRDMRASPVLDSLDRESFNALLQRSNLAREQKRRAIVPDVLGRTADQAQTELTAAGLSVEVVRSGPATSPEIVFAQTPNPGSRAAKVKLRVGPLSAATASLQLETSVPVRVGSPLIVRWQGPASEGDAILISKENVVIDAVPTKAGNPAQLFAPVDPGKYELLYGSGASKVFLARLPLVVSDAAASLQVRDSVEQGAELGLSWTGPNLSNDLVVLVPRDTEDGGYFDGLAVRASEPRPAVLRVPSDPGLYEARYLLGGRRVLARRAVTVRPANARITSPSEVEAGADLRFDWRGPNKPVDLISLVPLAMPDTKYVVGLTVPANGARPTKLQAPASAGEYELRYVVNAGTLDGKGLVATRSRVFVTPAKATITAQPEVRAAGELRVSWTGPCRKDDRIELVPADAPDGTYYERFAKPADTTLNTVLRAPAKPGSYELRYRLGGATFAGSAIIARTTVSVTTATASVRAPQRAKGGSTIEISWTGPNLDSDLIALVPVGTPDGKYHPQYAITGGTRARATLSVPSDSGEYELRYMLSGEEVIARHQIQIVEP